MMTKRLHWAESAMFLEHFPDVARATERQSVGTAISTLARTVYAAWFDVVGPIRALTSP